MGPVLLRLGGVGQESVDHPVEPLQTLFMGNLDLERGIARGLEDGSPGAEGLLGRVRAHGHGPEIRPVLTVVRVAAHANRMVPVVLVLEVVPEVEVDVDRLVDRRALDDQHDALACDSPDASTVLAVVGERVGNVDAPAREMRPNKVERRQFGWFHHFLQPEWL